jgi:hypothetical protein
MRRHFTCHSSSPGCPERRAGSPSPWRIAAGKVVLVAQPHHDDHTTDYGLGGVIARFVESGYKAYYVRASNDEKDGANSYGRNDITNLKETKDRHQNSRHGRSHQSQLAKRLHESDPAARAARAIDFSDPQI